MIQRTFRRGEIAFDKNDGHWYQGISHGHLHGGNVLVKVDEQGVIEDVKVIDWKKTAPAMIKDDVAEFILGKRDDLKSVDFTGSGKYGKPGILRRDGLEGFDFGKIAGDRGVQLDMTGARFDRAWADWADFEGVILRDTTFNDVYLFGASFVRADLKGAFFTKAKYVDFSYADMRNTTLHGDFKCSNFRYADLRGADVGDTDFNNAVLVKTIFDLDKAGYFEAQGYLVSRLKDHCLVTSPDKNINADSFRDYLDENLEGLSEVLGEGKRDILLRVPVEAIEYIGLNEVSAFLNAFIQSRNAYIEFYYMSGIGEEVPDRFYREYGIDKKKLPENFSKTKENTITLFPAFKGEEVTGVSVVTRIGDFDMKPTDSILMPIGMQNDPSGLVRGTVLGLRIMGFARELSTDGIRRRRISGIK